MSKNLYDLINSMSKSEKRHFAISNQGFKSGGKQMTLYRLFEKQKKYDGNAIRDKARKAGLGSNYAVSCNDLQASIMRSLRSYHASSSFEGKMRRILGNIEVYFTKGFYDQCEKELGKGKKLCDDYERADFGLVLNRWTRLLLKVRKSSVIDPKMVEQLEHEDNDHILKLKNESAYWSSSSLVFHHYREAMIRNDAESLDELKKILNSPIYLDEKYPKTLESKFTFHTVRTMYAQVEGDIEKMNIHSKAFISLMEAQPHMISENPTAYLKGKYNVVVSYMELLQYAEAEQELAELLATKDRFKIRDSEEVELLLFQYGNNLQVRLGNLQGKFGIARTIEQDVLEGVDKHARGLSELSLFKLYYDMSYSMFGDGDYKRALFWINKILQGKVPDWQKDVYHIIILNYLIHYELGNLDVLSSIARSLQRNLLRGSSKTVDGVLAKLLSGTSANKDITENKEATLALCEQFEDLRKTTMGASIIQNIDIVSWLRSKVEKGSFGEHCRRRVGSEA